MAHHNIQLTEVTVKDILDSNQIPIMFSILDPVKMRETVDPVEKLMNWELFQSLTSELVSPNIQIYSSTGCRLEKLQF
jgi:hypothetical protein